MDVEQQPGSLHDGVGHSGNQVDQHHLLDARAALEQQVDEIGLQAQKAA
jgi:hypothetical protein